MVGLSYDVEYGQLYGIGASNSKAPTTLLEVQARSSAFFDFYCGSYEDNSPMAAAAVTMTQTAFPRRDGSRCTIWTATPTRGASGSKRPAILYVHPGGHISGITEQFNSIIKRYARSLGHTVFSVDYRLAPQHPFPAGADDVYSAYKYLVENDEQHGIDNTKIVVMGSSSGAGLVAGLCIRLRNENYPRPPALQVLLEPMLDDRTTLSQEHPRTEFLSWPSLSNNLAWKALLGDDAGSPNADISEHIAPARAASLCNLPPAYIDVGSLDLFLEESLEYAKRLSMAGVPVELHVWPGLPHSHDVYGLQTTQKAMGSRINAIRKRT